MKGKDRKLLDHLCKKKYEDHMRNDHSNKKVFKVILLFCTKKIENLLKQNSQNMIKYFNLLQVQKSSSLC